MEKLNKNKILVKTYRLLNRQFSLNSELDWLQYPSILRIHYPIRKSYKDITEEKLLNKYAPSAVLVNSSGNILYIHGHTGLYLEPSPGYVGSSNVYKMARKEIRRQLRTCLQKSINNVSEARSTEIEINFNRKQFYVKLSVSPHLKNTVSPKKANLFLIIFEELQHQRQALMTEEGIERKPETTSPIVFHLEEKQLLEKSNELNQLRKELSITNEELEVSRKKLSSVKSEFASSEVELNAMKHQISGAKKELESLDNELNHIKNEVATKTRVSEQLKLDSESIKSELKKIKDESLSVNKELENKKTQLKELGKELTEAPLASVQEDNEKYDLNTESEVKTEEIKLSDMDYWPVEPEPIALIDDSTQTDYIHEEFGFLSDDNQISSLSSTPELNPISDLDFDLYASEELSTVEITDLDAPVTKDANETISNPILNNVPELETISALDFGQTDLIRPIDNNFQDHLESEEENGSLIFANVSEFETASAHGFRHDNTIRSVNIPEGVKSIRRSLFYQCTQLEKIILPSSLEVIEDFAFYGCQKLMEINLEKCVNLRTIGTSAFEGCSLISTLIFHSSLKEIETAAFLGCKSLISVSFQDASNLEILGSHVFKSCESIKLLKLPTNLKQIGISCFYGCTQLESVLLSEKIEAIGEYAFWACNSLKQISCPNKKLLKQPGFTIGFPQGIEII
jgi:archaellum component FlaC